MISLPYANLDNAVETSISGGRKHFVHRSPVIAYKTYDYDVMEGDNMHSLAMKVFNDDSLWWVLADLNPPKDSFAYGAGDKVKLPEILVNYNKGSNRIT